MLSISKLSQEEKRIAAKVFGPPPPQSSRKFTGAVIQDYQKIRREFMANANGKTLTYLVDYKLQVRAYETANPLGPPYDYGDDGVNLVEAVCPVVDPDMMTIVTIPVNQQLVAENAFHAQQIAFINANYPAARANQRPDLATLSATLQENTRHHQEVNRINNAVRIQLTGNYDQERDRKQRAEDKLKHDRQDVHDLFLEHFSGVVNPTPKLSFGGAVRVKRSFCGNRLVSELIFSKWLWIGSRERQALGKWLKA